MKIVLDANVVVAAFASRGLCESIFEFCLSGHEMILGVDLLDEIARNLRLKIGLPAVVVDGIKELLRENGTVFDPAPLPQNACRDPDDVKILGLAIASGADFVVTGDEDLLVLEKCQGIPILSPRSFSRVIHSEPRRVV
jgi:putative PIN family toxin of toxin-antitoxin system